jgi:bacteriocin biosynthesis cyclodehydratase domain-containing protein
MHPMLLPGTHLLRRADDRYQAGLGDGVVLPRPLTRPSDLVNDQAAADDLVRRGLAVADDRITREAFPAEAGGDAWHRHTVAALARRVGNRVGDALAGRSQQLIVVQPFGHPLSERLADDLLTLGDRAGLALSRARRIRARRPTLIHVLVGVGEPARHLLDRWLHVGRPHLVVRMVEGQALVGPYVVPGRTACLRCVDSWLADDDPSWPLLVEQYARASAADRPDGIPEPVDAALASLAVAWAVRDLATLAEGDVPTTWSSTVRVAADLSVIETRAWPPHPRCGCRWA